MADKKIELMFEEEISLDEPEPEFEEAEGIIFDDLGISEGFINAFKKLNPDNKLLTAKNTATNELIMFVIEMSTTLEKLEAINTIKLTAKQHKTLVERINEFKTVEEATEETLNLEPELVEALNIEEVQVLVEDKEGNMQDSDLIGMYIEKNGELIAENNELKEIRTSLLKENEQQQMQYANAMEVIESNDLKDKKISALEVLSRELTTIFGMLGINDSILEQKGIEDLTKEAKETLEGLFE